MRSLLNLIVVLTTLVGLDWSAVISCHSAEPYPTDTTEIGAKISEIRLTDYQGREWATSEFADVKGVVYAFLGTQCPLAKLYSTRLVELNAQYRDRGIKFVAVDPNVQDSLAEMGAHAKKFGFEFPFLKDPNQQWADHLGVTRTPEVCLVDSSSVLRYRGKIDDQYGIGYAKEKASARHLVDAIESLLSQREIAESLTSAPGCLIGRGKRSRATVAADSETVTYAKQISRIMQERCVSCHRDQEIGPMDLSNYDDVSAWADMILEVVNDGRMPPWHASPEYGKFSNERRLSQEEMDLLNRWVQQGLERGDPLDEPEPRRYAVGWQLPTEPDLVVPMSEKPFRIPPSGDVKYQYYVADPKLDHDTWVRGMEIVPGNRAVVHHVLVFLKDKNDTSRGRFDGERGFLTGYVPGTRVEFMPDGLAKRIPAGSQLVFQVHYTPIGTEQFDLSRVGFWFADPQTITHEVQTTSAVQTNFRIPPREGNYVTSAMLPERLPACDLLSMSPHMHLRGKAFRYTAVYPDGKREVLLDIPRYDFNWQTEYRLAEKKPLPNGTRIFCEATFDNSDKNLNNPNPDASVTWGDQTYEEMMIGYFHIAVPLDPKTKKAPKMAKEPLPRPSAIEIFQFLDKDGDGKLSRDQIPQNLKRVFDRLDKNKDNVLEKSEVADKN